MDYFSAIWFLLLLLAGFACMAPGGSTKTAGWIPVGITLVFASLLRLWPLLWCGENPPPGFAWVEPFLMVGASLAACVASGRLLRRRLPYALGAVLLLVCVGILEKAGMPSANHYARLLVWAPAFFVLGCSVLKLSGKFSGPAVVAIRLLFVGFLLLAVLHPAREVYETVSREASSRGNVIPVEKQLLEAILSSFACVAVLLGAWVRTREHRLAGLGFDARGRHREGVLWILFAAVLIAGGFWTTHASSHTDHANRAELVQEVKLVASALDPALIKYLGGLPSDADLPAYKVLKQQLADVVKASGSYRFAYLMTFKQGKVVFLVDNEPAESRDESFPGDVYTEAEPELIAAFQQPNSLATGPYRDQWGTWISGYSPVGNLMMNGAPVYLGLDDNAADWCRNLDRLRQEKMLETVILAFFIAGLLTINHLTSEVRLRQAFSEDRLRLSLQGANLVSWELDLGRKMLQIDPGVGKAGDLVNLPPRMSLEEFLGHVHPEDREKVKDYYGGFASENRGTVETEFRLRKEEHLYLWVIIRGQLTGQSRDGGGLCVTGLLFDISNRKKTELELIRRRQEASRLALVAQSTSDAVLISNTSGVVEWVNAGFTKITGYSPENIEGKMLEEFLGENAVDKTEAATVTNSLSETSGFKKRLSCRHKTGRPYWVDVEVQPLFEESGKRIGHMVILSDVTAAVQAEKNLLEAKNAADAANRAKSIFLATMSHEIRTPLNAVLGIASLLLETSLETKQRDYAAAICSSGETLLELINDILDYSKIEAGSIEIEQIRFELAAVVNETLEILSPEAAEKKIRLNAHLDADLPQVVSGDRMRLKQVLLNLVSNGVKFTEQGVVSLRLERGAGSEIRILVSDTGIGMSREVQERLFVPFMQADSSITRKYGGSGLGLAISKRLVELMGGTISVRSREGGGTTLVVALTLPEEKSEAGSGNREEREKQSAVLPQKPNPAPAEEPKNPEKEIRVLVAEDNPMNQKVIMLMLSRLGIKPVVVENGAEVMEAVKHQEFDLLLIDIQMPVMDGLEAARRLNTYFQEGKRPAIVALTANAFKEDREACFAAGMDEFLVKPITLDRLRSVLDKVRSSVS